MKTILFNLSLLILVSLVFSGCKKDKEEPKLSQQQKATQGLSSKSSWQVTSVILKPQTSIPDDDLLGLQISFNATGSGVNIAPGSFSATGAPDYLFSQSGAQWSWSGTDLSTIALSNASTGQLTNVSLSPNYLNPTSVVISFNVSGHGSRIKDITGNYTVKLE